MKREIIQTDRAPEAIGAYSQGTSCCQLIISSMQIALDPESGELVGDDHATQAHRALMNVQAIVEAGGSSLAGVLKATVYTTDIHAFAAINEVYADFFPVEPPARAVVEVSALPKGALVAIEIMAAKH